MPATRIPHRTGMRVLTGFLLSLLLALLLVAARPGAGVPTASASKGSILYAKAGKLWVMAPDGRRKRRVPHPGRFEWPSQSDDGTIVAQRGILLHRMNRRGRRLNRPITTAFRTNPILRSFKGPFSPQISPNGKMIAYSYSFTAETFDWTCNCTLIRPSFSVSYTRSNRFEARPERRFGNPGMYSEPSWIDDRDVLMTTGSLFDFGGNVLDQVAVDRVGGAGDRSYRRWFSECVGCDSLLTLKLHPLDDGELTRRRDKAVFVSGPLEGRPGSRLLIYPLRAPPPAVPSHFCQVTGASGDFSSPTWSPDGRSLAWADRRGVWVGRLGSLEGSDCEISRRLVAARGKWPDWGPARR